MDSVVRAAVDIEQVSRSVGPFFVLRAAKTSVESLTILPVFVCPVSSPEADAVEFSIPKALAKDLISSSVSRKLVVTLSLHIFFCFLFLRIDVPIFVGCISVTIVDWLVFQSTISWVSLSAEEVVDIF